MLRDHPALLQLRLDLFSRVFITRQLLGFFLDQRDGRRDSIPPHVWSQLCLDFFCRVFIASQFLAFLLDERGGRFVGEITRKQLL